MVGVVAVATGVVVLVVVIATMRVVAVVVVVKGLAVWPLIGGLFAWEPRIIQSVVPDVDSRHRRFAWRRHELCRFVWVRRGTSWIRACNH